MLALAMGILCIGCSSGNAAAETPAAPPSDEPSDKPESVMRVLQLNIWMDATSVPGAFDGLVDEIARLDVDLVALCEVSNHDGQTVDRLVAAL